MRQPQSGPPPGGCQKSQPSPRCSEWGPSPKSSPGDARVASGSQRTGDPAIFPKLPPSEYMTEMDRIYLTAEGQNLSVMECFNLAFRRLNAR